MLANARIGMACSRHTQGGGEPAGYESDSGGIVMQSGSWTITARNPRG